MRRGEGDEVALGSVSGGKGLSDGGAADGPAFSGEALAKG